MHFPMALLPTLFLEDGSMAMLKRTSDTFCSLSARRKYENAQRVEGPQRLALD